MSVSGADRKPPAAMVSARGGNGWDVATVVIELDVVDQQQSVQVAQLLFADERVLTVRIGGIGERSVYRIDVPRGDPGARTLGAAPAVDAAESLGIGLAFVRIAITQDGLGDPEGTPPAADAVPWTGQARRRPTLTGNEEAV